MKHIDYKQLKKYNIGKIGSTGFLLNPNSINTSGSSATQMYDYTLDTNQLQSNLLPQTIAKGGLYTSHAFELVKNISPHAYIASNASSLNANTAGAVGKAFSQMGTDMTTGVITGVEKAGETIAKSGAENAAKVSSNMYKSGLSTAGKALGVAGALYGGFNTYNDISNFNNRISSSQMMQGASTTTQNKYGVGYKQYGGFDTQGIIDYTNAQNRADTTSLALDAAGTGMSIGGVIGGPIGMGIGALVGGLGGWLFGSSKSKERMEAIKRDIDYTNKAMAGYNLQSESEASSKGLRNQFYDRADKGKNPTYNEGKVGDIRMVHTSQGIVPGIQFGLAGKGESIYNPNNGTASVYEEGLKRVDNIPTGVPLRKFNAGKEWGDTIIFGNRLNPFTGNTFADDAKPFSKILEQANKDNDMNINKHTRQLNIKNALNKLNTLANQQMLTANCGKNRFDEGKPNLGEYASILAPGLLQTGILLGNRRNYDPQVIDTYIPDTNSQAIVNSMRSRRVNIDPLISNILNQQRQLIYANNNAGGISGGMRRALNQQLGMQSASAINALHADKNNRDIAQMNEADKLAFSANQSDLARQQQARKDYATDLAAAYGKTFDKREANMMSMLNMIGGIGKDINSYRQYLSSKNTQNLMLKLYKQQIDNDAMRAIEAAGNASGRPRVSPYLLQGNWKYPVELPSFLDLIKLNPFSNIG